jgi:hypothetical protein
MTSRLPIATIGFGIGVNSIRAIYLRNERVIWAKEMIVDPAQPMAETLDALLGAIPRRVGLPPRVVAAIGPSRSQLRHLEGLPAVGDTGLLAALIAQNPARFFVQSGDMLCTTGVSLLDDGSVWAGAMSRAVVEEVSASCRRHGMRLRAALPTAAVLSHVHREGTAVWRDGTISLEVVSRDGILLSCRRVRVDPSPDPSDASGQLAAVDATELDAGRFADALGAGDALGSPLSYRPLPRPHGEGVSRRHLAIAAFVCVTGIVFGLAAPIWAAVRTEREGRAQLAGLSVRAREAVRTEAVLALSSARLRELSTFERSSRSMTLALAALTQAIPAPSMLTSLRVDDAGGTLVALTPTASGMLEALHDLEEISAPRIVGAVTPERAPVAPPVQMSPPGAAAARPPTLQRMTIRFDWRDAIRRGTAGRIK